MIKDAPKYLSLSALLLTIMSFLHLYVYYSAFGIHIFSFLTISELILQVVPFLLDWSMWLLFPPLFFITSDVFDKKIQVSSLLFVLIMTAPAFWVMIGLPGVLGWEVVSPLVIFLATLSLVCFTVGAFQGSETRKRRKQLGLAGAPTVSITELFKEKAIIISLAILSVIYATVVGQVRVNDIQVSDTPHLEYRIELVAGEIIDTSNQHRLIGTTQSHVFIYNREFSTIEIFSRDEVSRFLVCKRPESPLFARMIRIDKWYQD